MKLKLITLCSIIMLLTSCNIASQKVINSKQVSDLNQQTSHPKPKTETINTVPPYNLKESKEVYRTTAYDSRLLPDPNSNYQLTRIPENTKLIILDKKTVQQGRMQNNWYKVNYNEYTGWISGWNMEEGEELKITSVEEMEINYVKQIGEKPQNNPLTGKIDVILEWLKTNTYDPRSLEFIQWYQPYILSGYWNCRVEFRAKNAFGNYIKENKIFAIKNGIIVEVFDLY
ncbi:MAG: SH3 domain-containing protein [Pirellulales bacterium]|nr:SH3 domain-containing protein [Pirellulales bacterium]